jgi:hypothetical protein
MIIPINGNLRVEIDGDIQLQKRSIIQKEGPTKGNEVWSTLGYYCTIDQLSRGLLGRHIGLLLPENVKDVKTLAMVIEEVGAELSEKIGNLDLPEKPKVEAA